MILVETFPLDEVEVRFGGRVKLFVQDLVDYMVGIVFIMAFLFV